MSGSVSNLAARFGGSVSKSQSNLNSVQHKAASRAGSTNALNQQNGKLGHFKDSDLELFKLQFKAFDKDGNGVIGSQDLAAVCREIGEEVTAEDLHHKLSEVDLNKNNTIEFDEFLTLIAKIREGRAGTDRGFGAIYQKQAKMVKIQGATDATTHSINEEEQEQFCLHINAALKGDKDLAALLPVDPHEFSDLYEKCRNGLILR